MLKVILIFLIVCQVEGYSNGQNGYLASWNMFENFAQNSVSKLAENYQSILETVLQQSNVSQICSESLKNYTNDLKQFKTEALMRLDATGTRPVGLMSGSFYSYGQFEQCFDMLSSQYCLVSIGLPLPASRKYEGYLRKINPNSFNFNTEPFKYITDYIHFHRIANFTYGLCLPRGCSPDEVITLGSAVSDFYQTGLHFNIHWCDRKNPSPDLPIHFYVALIVVLTVLALNFAATFFTIPSLSDFNMKINYQKLIADPVESSLSCLHGIKAISMFMIVVSHALLGQIDENTSRLFKTVQLISSLSFLPAYFFPLAVDTFFMVTGLSMSMFIQKHKKVTMLPVLLGRYLRFVPSIAWAICIAYLLMNEWVKNELGGPNWFYDRATNFEKCQKTWLWNILLVQMWMDWKTDRSGSHSCLVTDWYLSVDMLCTILLTIVWIPISRGRLRQALACTWLFIIAGVVFSMLSLYFLDLRHFWRISDFIDSSSIQYNRVFHLKPVAHLGSYFVGVLLGFLLENKSRKLSWAKVNLGWIAWFTGWSIHLFFFYYNDYDSKFYWWASLVYGSFAKSLWSAMVAWLIFTIKEGLAYQLIDKLLSSKPLLIASRMSLSILCLNLVIFRFRNGIATVPMEISLFKFMYLDQLPYFVIIYLISFASRIIVESPFSNLVAKLFTRKSRPKKEEPVEMENPEASQESDDSKETANKIDQNRLSLKVES